jgi:exodeoxyribonuclease VII large subunit
MPWRAIFMMPGEPLTVTQLATLLKESLESTFSRVSVVGELSGVSRPPSGHCYFTLKDSVNLVSGVMWKSSLGRLRFEPHNGQQVVVRGRVTFFGGQGKCQISADAIEPVGFGAAELAKRQLIEKLRAKGYFDAERKRPLPAWPRRVGIVSSATGAVVRDMLELLGQRWPLCEAVVVHSRVQGETAPAELVAAIELLARAHSTAALRLDAIIVGRGGGSAEDLIAFDAEIVANAIASAPVPVISAVGHEIDVSIADLVADVRAETPSAAIMALVPHRDEWLSRLEAIPSRMRDALQSKQSHAKRRLDLIATRPVFARPLDRVRLLEQRLDGLDERLHAAMTRRLTRTERHLIALSDRLTALAPMSILHRGYSITRTAAGQTITDSAQAPRGTAIITTLASGTLTSTVE